MRRLAALVAIFTIIGSNAWAFDPSHEVVGQIYFSIPFGAATKQQATPRLGFRVGFGEASTFADRSARAPFGVLVASEPRRSDHPADKRHRYS
jgi:hypothetical protein